MGLYEREDIQAVTPLLKIEGSSKKNAYAPYSFFYIYEYVFICSYKINTKDVKL